MTTLDRAPSTTRDTIDPRGVVRRRARAVMRPPSTRRSCTLRCIALGLLTLGAVSLAGCSGSHTAAGGPEDASGADSGQGILKTDQGKLALSRDTMLNGVLYQGGTTVEFYESGNVATGVLATDARVPGNSTIEALAQFFKDGQIQKGVMYKAGTPVRFHSTGQLAEGTLAVDTNVQGTIHKAGTTLTYLQDGSIESTCTPAGAAAVKGMMFEAGTPLCVYTNGSIRSGTLASGISVQGTDYAVGTRVWFNDKGEVEKAVDADGVVELHLSNGPVIYGESGTEEFSKDGDLTRVKLARPISLQGVEYQPGTYLNLDASVEVTAAYFKASAAPIQGVPYRVGSTVPLQKNGLVETGELGADHTMQGLNLKGGTRVYYYDTGKVKKGTLAADTSLQGVTFKAGTLITLYKNGKVAVGTPAGEAAAFQGVRYTSDDESPEDPATRRLPYCRDKMGAVGEGAEPGPCRHEPGTLEFYESGILRGGVLAADAKVGDVPLKGGTYVRYHSNGELARGIMASDTEVDVVTCQGGEPIEFYDNGQLESAIMVKNAKILGTLYAGNSDKIKPVGGPPPESVPARVEFYASGKLKMAKLLTPMSIKGAKYQAGTAIELYEDGKVKSGTLAAHTLIRIPQGYTRVRGVAQKVGKTPGAVFKADTRVSYYPDGKIESGTLMTKTTMNGIVYPPGTTLTFEYGPIEEAGKSKK